MNDSQPIYWRGRVRSLGELVSAKEISPKNLRDVLKAMGETPDNNQEAKK